MRTSSLALAILTVLVLLTMAATRLDAATPPGGRMANELIKKQAPPPEPSRADKVSDWISSLSVSPVGAIRTAEIFKGSDWGAGVDIGVPLNKNVSLHLVNLAYEDSDWRSSAIDDTGLHFEARLFNKDSLSVYGIGGGARSWSNDDWAFSAGLGARLKLGRNVSLGGDYSLRAWFDSEEDALTRFYLQFSF